MSALFKHAPGTTQHADCIAEDCYADGEDGGASGESKAEEDAGAGSEAGAACGSAPHGPESPRAPPRPVTPTSSTTTKAVGADAPSPGWFGVVLGWWGGFYAANSFLVLAVCAILLARAYPPLGAVYLAPHVTATWICVVFIFVLAGLSLKTREFRHAFQRVRFNMFVQLYNFGVVSGLAFGFSRLLLATNALGPALANGMVICSCLPLTINMVLVLTKSSGGDEASAIFHAACGNMIGVFLTPFLVLGYVGTRGSVDMGIVFYKLGLRVILPIAVGQALQRFARAVVSFVEGHRRRLKTVQEWCLVFIVYTVFCKTFLSDIGATAGEALSMVGFQFGLLVAVMGLAWYALKVLFRTQPTLRVMGLFGCTHKTVAMGVPMINAMYEDDPNVGLYTLPLLVWHPMQLFVGTFLAPRLAAFVERERKRSDEVGSLDVQCSDERCGEH